MSTVWGGLLITRVIVGGGFGWFWGGPHRTGGISGLLMIYPQQPSTTPNDPVECRRPANLGRRYLETQAEPGHSVWFSAFYIIGAQADGTLTEGWFCGPSGIPREKYNKTLNTRTHVTHPRVHTHAHTWDTHVCTYIRTHVAHPHAHTRTQSHTHGYPEKNTTKSRKIMKNHEKT